MLARRQHDPRYVSKYREFTLPAICAELFEFLSIKLSLFFFQASSRSFKFNRKFRMACEFHDRSIPFFPLFFIHIPRRKAFRKLYFSLLCMTYRKHLVQGIFAEEINIFCHAV